MEPGIYHLSVEGTKHRRWELVRGAAMLSVSADGTILALDPISEAWTRRHPFTPEDLERATRDEPPAR